MRVYRPVSVEFRMHENEAKRTMDKGVEESAR
jgi:hypothetical protein